MQYSTYDANPIYDAMLIVLHDTCIILYYALLLSCIRYQHH